MKLIDLKEVFHLFVYCLFELVDEMLLLLAYGEREEIGEEGKNRRCCCSFVANVWCLQEPEALSGPSLSFLPRIFLDTRVLLLNIIPTF